MAQKNFDRDPRNLHIPEDRTQGGRALPQGQLPRTRRALEVFLNIHPKGHTSQIMMRYDPVECPVYRDINMDN